MLSAIASKLTEADLYNALEGFWRDDVPPRGRRCIHFWEGLFGSKGAAEWLRVHFPGCIEPCEHDETTA